MKLADSDFYDEAALFERLTSGVRQANKSVRFLVGSAVTAASAPEEAGVLDVAGVVRLIREELGPDQTPALDSAIAGSNNLYQSAFQFYLGRRGIQGANNIIKKAVWASRKPVSLLEGVSKYRPEIDTSDEVCEQLDQDYEGWCISPAAKSIGELAASHPKYFGKNILTTNFDPILGAAIKTSSGVFMRTVLHRDGDISQTSGDGCHIIHLHGYWYGSDTLHTPRQLTQDRPRLKSSLIHLIGNDTLVVVGYGGWDDIITRTLVDIVIDDRSFAEIVWIFRDRNPEISPTLLEILAPGIERGRVSLYAGIDCHVFFPKLIEKWNNLENIQTVINNSEDVTKYERRKKESKPIPVLQRADRIIFDRYDQDDPPQIEFYVGREAEAKIIQQTDCSSIILTGLGGQGKTAIAASYFGSDSAKNNYDYRIWRDCREERDRFENQIATIISAMSRGSISAKDIAARPFQEIIDLFIELLGSDSVLFVFDNIDHYVDLSSGQLIGSPSLLLEKIGNIETNCKFIFTCRPEVTVSHQNVLIHRVQGLSLESAKELFRHRGASSSAESIADAHALTGGHAFWLDLLAAQVAKRSSEIELEDLIERIPSGHTAEIPQRTLQSIWSGLKDREQLVLRALAETVRPATEIQVAEFLRGQINYNQVVKATNSLRSQSLVVVKQSAETHRLLELHPLLRTFMRTRFSKSERMSFIDAVIKTYLPLVNTAAPLVDTKPKIERLLYWVDIAELYAVAGNASKAFSYLESVAYAMKGSDAPQEFTRVARILFAEIEWGLFEEIDDAELVFETHFEILARYGRIDECNNLLENYRGTIEGKGVRYIQYCNLQCYLNWVNGNYPVAIRWGEEGVELKSKSNADTAFDAAHNLALSRRDAGLIEPALEYFQGGVPLEEIVSSDAIDDKRTGAFYGNIGRCLQMMGQLQPAAIALKKAAKLVDQKADGERMANQAYARQWLGELKMTTGDMLSAEMFLRAALKKWEVVSPPRARAIQSKLSELPEKTESLSDSQCEKKFQDWLNEK
ncbi:SIR2 family protein [uncultured Brevundimonas sp.]|uniref:SIR2 family protein n=1 Tax=uncultured Brevundimonas sp. TaxID=213418 RepID=UPI0025F23B3D|nr:SIR2 family protein [uncultured Brevundimonas sp.]